MTNNIKDTITDYRNLLTEIVVSKLKSFPGITITHEHINKNTTEKSPCSCRSVGLRKSLTVSLTTDKPERLFGSFFNVCENTLGPISRLPLYKTIRMSFIIGSTMPSVEDTVNNNKRISIVFEDTSDRNIIFYLVEVAEHVRKETGVSVLDDDMVNRINTAHKKLVALNAFHN